MVQINSKFKPIYTTNKRYILLTGGRGSGKTFVVQDFLVRLLEEVGQGILYTRYTMTSVETTIIPLFKAYIEKIADIRNYTITRNKIIHKRTGSFIYFSGIKANSKDQTGRLKSLPNITTWVIEEGEDFNDEKAFIDIDDSIRSNSIQNRIIWIQNPTTSEHFIYKRFFESSHIEEAVEDAGEWVDENGKPRKFVYQKSIHKDVEHIHTTYLDNAKNLNAEKIQQWEETKVRNPSKYNHKYIGAWIDKAEGVIFDNWSEGLFDYSLAHAYGQDYGFTTDPTTLIKVAVDNKRKIVYLHEEFYETTLNGKQLGTNDIFEINKSRISSEFDLIVADSQEARLIYDLRTLGLNIQECEKGPGSVKAGILALLDYEFIVTKESMNIKKELKNYCWNDKKAGIPIDEYNHAMDSIRYIFNRLATGLNPYIIM
jgi:phage terminase large subunit